VPAAAPLAALTMGSPLGHTAFATIAAAFSRLGFALNPALGYLAFAASARPHEIRCREASPMIRQGWR